MWRACLRGGVLAAGAVLALSSVAQVSAPGVTQALKETKLSLTVAGRIDGVLVKEGQPVQKGQILLYLDRTAEELEVQRRRLLLQDVARLNELREKEKVLSEQVSSLKSLLASGGVSRKQAEDEELALGAVSSERKALESSKQREQVELNLAIEAYERRHLRAPITGIVTKLVPRAGESIGAHEPMVHVVNVSRVRFLGNVQSQLSAALKVGNKVTIKLGLDASAQSREARIVFVSPVTDPASGLVEVIAEFDNKDGSVRPGITGRMASARLAALAHFDGPLEAFWPLYLQAVAQALTARRVLLLTSAVGRPWQARAQWPAQGADAPGDADWTLLLVEQVKDGLPHAQCNEADELALVMMAPSDPGTPVFAVVALDVDTREWEEDGLCAWAALAAPIPALFGVQSQSRAQALAAQKALQTAAAPAPGSAVTADSVAPAHSEADVQTRAERLHDILRLSIALSQESRFMPLAMALCNELALRFDCTRVSLGWVDGHYVRLVAVSHVENFDAKSSASRALEAAMEEAL
eukprot:gene34271-41483_t